MISADADRYENNVLLRRNTPVPARVIEEKHLQTSPGKDNTWDVHLLQGDHPAPANNTVLGRFTFHGVPHYQGRTRVRLEYDYDQNMIGGVLRFDKLSGKSLGGPEFTPGPLDIEWSLEAPSTHVSQAMDIMFLVDTSGSMSSEIEGVKQSCLEFARQMEAAGAKVGLGLVGFGIGSRDGAVGANHKVHFLSTYTIGVYDLVALDVFRGKIEGLHVGLFGGGGCYLADATTVDIFPHILNLFGHDGRSAISRLTGSTGPRSAKRVLVVISDEMGDNRGLATIVSLLATANIVTHDLGVPRSGGAHERLATATGGCFWSSSAADGKQDFSGLLQVVAHTIAQNLPQGLARR